MKKYIRKIDQQCISKQISYTKEILRVFLDNLNDGETIDCIGVNSKKSEKVQILLATDPRFNNNIQKVLSYEGNLEVDDFMVMTKIRSKYYSVELIKPTNPQYEFFKSCFEDSERHALLLSDEKEQEVSSSKSTEAIGENRVVYGTPGCGKSYYVDKVILKDYKKENIIRTTFYQDYTNTDFVGQILPKVKPDKSVEYEFVPGPFAIALGKALMNKTENVALVIEELNRGNAASIFGDVFQLLDRKTEDGNIGESTYGIVNNNLQTYLNGILETKVLEIRIPSNLSIYATMNTSDQNVFTLDTAFKRRWKFEKLSNDFDDYKELYGKEHPFKDDLIPGMLETWKSFVETINEAILNEADITKSEDKQLGIFFVDKNGLVEQGNVDPHDKGKVKEFAYKIFEYLWDDVLKYCRENWFGKEIKSLDDLIKEYIEKADKNEGAEVFVNGIFKENK